MGIAAGQSGFSGAMQAIWVQRGLPVNLSTVVPCALVRRHQRPAQRIVRLGRTRHTEPSQFLMYFPM